jgi:hypothetical protein
VIIYEAAPAAIANLDTISGGIGTAFIDLSGCGATQTIVADPVAMDSPFRVSVQVYFMLRAEMLTMRTWISTSSSNRSGR